MAFYDLQPSSGRVPPQPGWIDAHLGPPSRRSRLRSPVNHGSPAPQWAAADRTRAVRSKAKSSTTRSGRWPKTARTTSTA
jgi:hypothetical protein